MIEDAIKIVEINDTGVVIQSDGVISTIFKITSSGGYESTNAEVKQTLNNNLLIFEESMPQNSSLQIIYSYEKSRYSYSETEINSFSSYLTSYRNKFLAKSSYLAEEIYISIGISIKRKNLSYLKEITNSFFQKEKITNAYDDLKLLLEDLGNRFKIFCTDNSLGTIQLDKEKCYSLIYEYMNNSKINKGDLNTDAKKYSLIDKKLFINKNGECSLGNEFINAVSLKLQPKEIYSFSERGSLALPYLSSLRHELNFPHKVILTIVKDDRNKIIQNLKNAKNLSVLFGGNSDKNRSKIESIKNYITYVEEQNLDLCLFSLCVIHYNEDKKLLTARTNEILTKFKKMNQASGILETYKTADLFINNCYGTHFNNKNMIPMATELTSNYINFQKYYEGEENGIILKNRIGQVVKMNIRSPKLDNKNSIIIGPTGSGKSFTEQYYSSQFIEDNQILIGIDKGQSSRHTFELHGATIHDFDFDNPIPLNPFHVTNKNKISYHKIEFLTNYISFLCKDNNQRKQDLPKSLIAEISNLIPITYSTVEGIPILEDFYNLFCKTEMPDVTDKHKYEANIKSYISRESIAQFINRHGTLEINTNEHTYFDIKNISKVDDLTALVAMSIIDLCYELLESDNHKFINIFTDEAWDILQNPDLGLDKFLVYLFREIRKMNGGITAIAQAASDFEFSQEVKDAIMNNFDTLIILRQNDKSISVTRDVFNLSDYQVNYINSIKKVNGKYAEFYVKQKSLETILRIEPSPLEYWMYNTTPSEITKKKELIAQCGGNVLEAAKKAIGEIK